jgi:hypothetical protein
VNGFAPLSRSSSAGDRSPQALASGSSIDDYLRGVEAKPGFAASLEHVRQQRIVFVTAAAKPPGDPATPTANKSGGAAGSPSLVWFVLRRVDENTRMSVLLYLVLKEAKALYQVCYAMLCYVMLCYAMRCYAMLCVPDLTRRAEALSRV